MPLLLLLRAQVADDWVPSVWPAKEPNNKYRVAWQRDDVDRALLHTDHSQFRRVGARFAVTSKQPGKGRSGAATPCTF